ncbi:MAG: TIGR02444 family protein [Minwuia sp.]|nr:TIGR02444 family protein [Minwuia sp.]
MAVFSSGIFPPNELWDYATRVYGRGRAQEACLAMQDRHGLDVNVLMFCCWVASSGRGRFRDGELEHALQAVDRWHDHVIGNLHQLKLFLKGGVAPAPKTLSDDLRRVVVESELHAEHVEVLMLHTSLTRVGTGTFDRVQQIEDSLANLFRYFTLINVDTDDRDLSALIEILIAAFPDELPGRIETLAAGAAFRLKAGSGARRSF